MRRFAAIPAHPQKQYTRRWRLYHFCGFYYPIREVIPIAIYHWNIGIVSRGKGKSAVAAAAYRSGEKLTNEWDGMTHDYTRKGGVVHTEIMLPPHAPPSFSDRSTLWNSVELYEKAGNAQLAREIDAALPIELSREEQIRLVREYCSSQFVSRGMCVDFAIHDTDSGNPHCHIMLTMRPLNERGAWAAKSKKEYDLDENGERIRLPSGRYKTHKVDLTGWNDKDNTLLWRKAWADFTNDFLERNGSPERIDHRSNAERGIDEIPTVHMGVAACQMEKKGIATERGELNRSIKAANRLLRDIKAQIGKLKEWLLDVFKAKERLTVTYNPDAPTPKKWLQFLSELLQPEDIPTLQEFLGYCLLPTTKGQKMLMLIGKGGEGKSRIGLVMRSLLGDSMNTTSIQKVESNRFSRADLENKLLMVDDDMDMSALPKTNYIKSIVTSECKMDMERKGVQSYQSQLYVRFLCFGNGALTALHDKSDGFFRRQIVLTTKDRPAGRADDPFLVDKLLREKEGIFLWCLEGLHRLIGNNYQFSISGKARENMETVKRSSNNVIEFLQSEGYIRFRADSEASSKAIYEVYTRWCDDNAQKPMSANRVSSELAQNEQLYNVEATNNVHVGGKRVRGFVGIEVVNPPPY